MPPQTTRARLRGDFIRRAQEQRRDFTVDWVHLKLNDQAQRTVLCKDPFRSVDDRVEKLIAGMCAAQDTPRHPARLGPRTFLVRGPCHGLEWRGPGTARGVSPTYAV